MKSLLITTELFNIGGLETHVAGEVACLAEEGFRIHLVAGANTSDKMLPKEATSVTTGLAMGPAMSTAELIQTVESLRKIIREQDVECVHAHPFMSLVPSQIAAELEGIPFVVTLHGPASLSDCYGPLYDFILSSVILPKADMVVAVSQEVADLAAPYVDDARLCVLPNGVPVGIFDDDPVKDHGDGRWLLVSRLDTHKVVGIRDFIQKSAAAGLPGVLIVGDGDARCKLQSQLDSDGLSNYVEFFGATTDVPKLMQRAAGVAGMGRVVLEGLACGKPVVLVGYDGVKGVVTSDVFRVASATNFSGRRMPSIDATAFLRQLSEVKRGAFGLTDRVKVEYSDKTIWQKFAQHIRGLKTHGRSLLSDAYIKFASEINAPAEAYLHSHSWFEQVGRLAHSLKHFDQSVAANFNYTKKLYMDNNLVMQIASLNQAVAERDGQIATLSQAVTERDGQIASLNQAMAERDGQIAALSQAVTVSDKQITSLNEASTERDGLISQLNNEMANIRQSTSWRITSPLRVAKNLVTSPKRTTYSIIRSLFWKLPAGLRQALHSPRHAFVRCVRGLPPPHSQTISNSTLSDLSWTEFNEKVLSKRDDYKGVFIQELVIDWNVPLYQRPQHISAALGRLGYLVIYRTDNWAGDDVNGFREVSNNVWITNRYEVEEIQGCVRSLYSTAYANTPELLLKNGKRGRIVYEYIDHIDPEISGDQENIRRLLSLKNFAFGGGADFIVASARKLYEEAVEAVGKEKVILVPNGVDTIHYRSPLHITTSIPESLVLFKEKHKAIVGYFGALAPWLWYDVIAELASQRPDLGFVFIGPDYYGGSEKLPKFDNVLYLGTIDYKILPAYARQFDVCLIPFKPSEIAKTTSPLKLFEYFALEKPVVVTACMDECTAYPEVFRGESALELDNAINDALRVKDDPSFLARLRELADRNDWCKRAHTYEAVFFKRSSLDNIQQLIRDSHRMDGEGKTYYEDAYMAQEMLYWRPVVKWIDDLRDINAVVDVGAAYGTLLSYVAINNGCREVYAIDPVGYMSNSLRNKLGIKLVRMDFEREAIDLPVKFDLVIFTEVIEHLNFHPLPTMLKLKSLLKLGGKLLLTTPDAAEWGRVTDYYSSLDAIPQYDGRESEWIDGHIWQYTKDELEDLLDKAGFIVERFDYSPGVAARHLCYLLSVRS